MTKENNTDPKCIQINSEFTLAAVIDKQRQITERCKLQYLKVLEDAYIKAQQEYIDTRNKIMV